MDYIVLFRESPGHDRQPRPFTDLIVYDGMEREARYTDTYARRDGEWKRIAGEVVAKGEWHR